MLFKLIVLIGLFISLGFVPIGVELKIGLSLGIFLFFFIIDYYILKKVEFYKILTIGVSLLVSFGILYLITQTLYVLPNNNLLGENEKYGIVLFFLFTLLYLSFQIGFSSTYFKKMKTNKREEAKHLIDTSAIIDGRLLEIAKSGFTPKSLIIPNFVIRELQLISDSSNNEKRNKGRRGLDLLKQMKNSDYLSIQIVNDDVRSAKNVDNKLLALAAEKGYKIITTDFNLFKVAQVQGIEALNINHLASLIKPNINVNDRIRVFILKKGNNKGQGLAFLPDDTMVIIEGGERYIGTQKQIVIISYIQNESGKMVFAKVLE